MAGVIDWSCKVDEIGPEGLKSARSASAAERAKIAAELELLALDALSVDIEIKRGSGGRHRLSGRMRADVTQACVVTLEPVRARIDESFAVDFWPPEDIGPLAEGEHSVLEVEVPEPIDNGHMAVGRVVYEQLAASVDPYPRQPDANFDGVALGPAGLGDKPAHPFAALAKLKDKR